MGQDKNRNRSKRMPGPDEASQGTQAKAMHGVFQDAFDRWADEPSMAITLEMPRILTLALVSAVQIMVRQESSSEMRECIIEMGRGVQKEICDDPALYLIVDSGWPR
ncbi:hypothetical protein ACQEU6_25755 [Spirillospora sp. CA-108201]